MAKAEHHLARRGGHAGDGRRGRPGSGNGGAIGR